MPSEFLEVQTTLPLTGCTRQHVYDLVQQAVPTSEMADTAEAGTDSTLEVLATGRLAAALRVPRWRFYEVDYQDASLAVAGLAANVELFELGAGGGLGMVHEVVLKHGAVWGGPSISALSCTVGTSGALTEFYGAGTPFDLTAAVGASVYGRRILAAADAGTLSVDGNLLVRFTAVGANLDQLTSGTLVVGVLYSEVVV